jgi:putative tricarboxylic transport membrane protein
LDISVILERLTTGFGNALTPQNLLFAILGVVMGTMIGVLPGIGPALTISLLLPVTFGMDNPAGAFILFGGIYYGAMYGGSTTSILVNTPGESSSVVTAIDGHQMARRGRAGAALATSAIGSFIAGTFATLMITLVGPLFADIALRFGAAEYFAVMVLALTTVTGLAGDSMPKALFSTVLGLTLGLIGIDQLSSQQRFTLGIPQLIDGIDVVLVAIAFFAVGEVFWTAATWEKSKASIISKAGGLMMTREEWRRSAPAWFRGSALGFFVGILPGAGSTIASFLSYNVERRLTRHPKEFGKGAIEAVAGPEASNNAEAGGSLLTLLTLGLPASGTTAMLLVAFQIFNLQPGPLLFTNQSELVWSLIASLYIANVMLLILNLPLVGLWVKLLEIPRPLLYACILAFSALGVYSRHGSAVDIVIMFVLGLVSFGMRKYNFPIAPVILGVVLAPLMETQFRRAVSISVGDYSVFFTRIGSALILAVAAVLLFGPFVAAFIARKRGRALVPSLTDEGD